MENPRMAPNTSPCWVYVDVECRRWYPCRDDIPSVVLQERLGMPEEDSSLVDHLQL